MDISRAFYENFFSFAAMLSEAPHGAALRFAPPSLAAASGLPYAGENYAVFAENASIGDAASAISFFKERQADFIAPLLPHAPRSLADFLAEKGILHRESYTSMCLPLEKMRGEYPNRDVVRIVENDFARWAAAVWRAFGGAEGEEEKNYEPFGSYLAAHASNSAFALEKNAEFVSTALIHETSGALGLYYFATLPRQRRRGRAAELMDGLLFSLRAKEKPLVLLATPAGLPFYLKYGFAAIEALPIYSAVEDI